MGTPYETSVLEIGYVLPPEDNFYANQVIGCYLYDPTHGPGHRRAGRAGPHGWQRPGTGR